MPSGQLNGSTRFQVVRAEDKQSPLVEETNALIREEEEAPARTTNIDVEKGARCLPSGRSFMACFLGSLSFALFSATNLALIALVARLSVIYWVNEEFSPYHSRFLDSSALTRF